MRQLVFAAAIAVLLCPAVSAAEVDYARDVKPILTARCTACHGAVRQKAGLRLDAGQLVRKGGKKGPVVVPGKPDESSLLAAVIGEERSRMPPEAEGEALPAKDIATLRAWIEQGAKAPDEPVPEDPKNHWAYRPPVRPAIPGAGNPIDAFLAAARAKHGLTPSPPADKPTLLRRVFIDLIGLPPTRGDLHAFLADASPDAYEKVVDRLLASPHYGERWGRHWLDVWRYSDPFGLGEDYRYSQRHVWKWRDWVVESLNADKGYDRMVVEMLAADEAAPADRANLRATGYLARNWYKFNRNVWVQDATEYTAAGFLGVTVRCCRCHDHKYDPVSQEDYYRLRAFFEPHDVRIDPVPGQPDTKKDGIARAFDGMPDAPTYLFHRGDERSPDESRVIAPGVPAVLGGEVRVAPVRVLPQRGVIAAAASGLVYRSPETSTGRRLALAKWITARGNPLTARVAVNHIWMRHLGKPLVASVANFGLSGAKPTHPELLDWLAVEFMESGWQMKRLHRLLVTSVAYRQSSRDVGENRKLDPDNRHLWRMNPRRLEAEAVRDCVLAAAGNLDPTLGGPILDEKLGQTSRRRSLYFRFNAEYKMAFLDQFDPASPTECFERRESVIPQQALALSNSVLALNQSRLLAKNLSETAADPAVFVTIAFETVLGRRPAAEERDRCVKFLQDQAGVLKDPKALTPFPPGGGGVTPPAADPAKRAREDLIQVLFNHNDFVTVR